MFAYIDPGIRARLVAEGKLYRIDAHGEHIAVDGVSTDSDLTLNVLGPIPMPLELAEGHVVGARWFAFVRHTELSKAEELAAALRARGDQVLFSVLSPFMSVNCAFVVGELEGDDEILVRVHSNCLTGDVFGSARCECGPQLRTALGRIDERGRGVLIYMAGHEGRGIGLWAKAVTYLLQDGGESTYQANRSLGLPDDSRDFSDAAAMLLHLLGGDRAIELMSNNPKKLQDLAARGLTRIRPAKHVAGVGEHNRRYLRAKRDWGHRLDPDDLE